MAARHLLVDGNPPFHFVFYSEIEKFPCEVLKQRHPDVPNLGDMTKFKDWPEKCACQRAEFNGRKKTITIGGIKLEIYACKNCGGIRIDILIGGTPCQSFSVAGLRAGLRDPRGNLALVFLAIAERYQPKWVVWENVPGVHSSWSDVAAHPAAEENLSALRVAVETCRAAGLELGAEFSSREFEEVDQSNDFDGFLAGLEGIGYGAATRILDAQYFHLAQRRERVFVIGHLGGEWQRAAAVLFERESLSGNPPPSRSAGKGVAGTIAQSSFSGGGICDAATENAKKENSANKCFEITGPLQSRESAGGGFGTDFEAKGGLVPEIAGTLTKNYATHGGKQVGNNGGVVEVCGTLSDGAHMGGGSTVRTPIAAESSRSLNQPYPPLPEIAWTLQHRDAKGPDSSTKEGHLLPIHRGGFFDDNSNEPHWAVRRLTPRECERLQGFPDDYTLIIIRGKPASDGPRYKALGNSMAVMNIEWIWKRILLISDLRIPI